MELFALLHSNAFFISMPTAQGRVHMISIANAPVSWGVDYADDPANPPWRNVMSEIAAAGFKHTELGPLGYYPTDPGELTQAFSERGLTPVAGFVFEKLHDPSCADEVLESAKRTINILSALNAKYLVVIDHISDERMATAGNSAIAKRLDEVRYQHMISVIREISEIARSANVQPVIHQHAGCYIEFEDEIERVLADISQREAGICIDTGHMAYAGIDPIAFYEKHADRVQYFHFKNIDPEVHRRVVSDCVPFLDAVSMNVFCPLDSGVVDFVELHTTLCKHGFTGCANIEQDINPRETATPLQDAKRSLRYLKWVGF